MRKRAAALGIVAGLTAGGTAALAFTPTVSGAQSTTTTAPAADSGSTATTPPDRSAWMTEALAPLVTDGTITQAQADAVVAALQAAAPERGPGGRHGVKHLDAAAAALGMTVDELRTAIDGGQTIAQVAAAKGVSVQTVIDALVGDAKTRLAADVADGKLTQAEADERLAASTERITAFVNGTLPDRPDGPAPTTTPSTPSTTAAA